jgi:hypothetical protein
MTTIDLKDLFTSPGGLRFDVPPWLWDLANAERIILDLAETSAPGVRVEKVRLDTVRVCLLANVLSSVRPTVPVELRLPRSGALLLQLARTPLFSVLASRMGNDDPPQELLRWRHVWNPHDAVQRAEMLKADDQPFGPNQRHLLTLASLHKRSRSDLQRDARGVVDPWLGRRFVARGKSSQRSEAMRDLERVMSELIENIGDHADIAKTGRPPSSVAQLMTTAGGGSSSSDRFRLTVMDNGIGLPKSIKARMGGGINGLTAVTRAFEGQLRYGDRGRGLPHVCSVITRHPGSYFALFTELFPERNRSIIATVDSSGMMNFSEIDAPLFGTLAIGQIVLPSLAMEQPQLFDIEEDDLTPASA